MKNINLYFAFFLACFFSLILPSFNLFPPLTYFAPFFVILFYQKSKESCLLISFFIGLWQDSLSSDHLGVMAINYSLSTLILRPLKQHFFEDRFSTLPIMVFLFSFVSTLFQMLLLDILDQSFVLTWHWVITDLLIMPLVDACYGAIFGIKLKKILPFKFSKRQS